MPVKARASFVVSLLLSRGVASPVINLTGASQRIAEGHYAEYVQNAGADELGQLACSFNQMAEKYSSPQNEWITNLILHP